MRTFQEVLSGRLEVFISMRTRTMPVPCLSCSRENATLLHNDDRYEFSRAIRKQVQPSCSSLDSSIFQGNKGKYIYIYSQQLQQPPQGNKGYVTYLCQVANRY
jgi:hypothetical protein